MQIKGLVILTIVWMLYKLMDDSIARYGIPRSHGLPCSVRLARALTTPILLKISEINLKKRWVYQFSRGSFIRFWASTNILDWVFNTLPCQPQADVRWNKVGTVNRGELIWISSFSSIFLLSQTTFIFKFTNTVSFMAHILRRQSLNFFI